MTTETGMSNLTVTLPNGTQIPFKVKIHGVATVTNPPMDERVTAIMKDRYRQGLPDMEGFVLPPDIKQALDREREEAQDDGP